jgi:hypothetical protein
MLSLDCFNCQICCWCFRGVYLKESLMFESLGVLGIYILIVFVRLCTPFGEYLLLNGGVFIATAYGYTAVALVFFE